MCSPIPFLSNVKDASSPSSLVNLPTQADSHHHVSRSHRAAPLNTHDNTNILQSMILPSLPPLPSPSLLPRLILHWQIHPNPPRTQSYPLLLTHSHTRIIPLNQLNIRPLRMCILCELLCLLDLRCRVSRRGLHDCVAESLLDGGWRRELLVRGACGDGVGGEGEFAEETAVEGADLGGEVSHFVGGRLGIWWVS
jgi:hypothetical protein